MAVEWLERAGEVASDQLAYEEGLDHYRAALAALQRCPTDEDRRYRLLVGVGTAANALSDFETAQPAWLEAASVARLLRDPDRLGAATYGYSYLMQFGRQDDALVSLINETLDMAGPGESPLRVPCPLAGLMPLDLVCNNMTDTLYQSRERGYDRLSQIEGVRCFILDADERICQYK